MKRISSVVVPATAALALLLAGCGSDDRADETNAAPASAAATSEAADPSQTARPDDSAESEPESETPVDTDETPTDPGEAAPTTASDTTCAQFKALDEDEQKALIEQILAEHPESSFVGSPNVALGTAILVCNASNLADTPVAGAAGLIRKN